jgi:nucleosome binding factor SPN SPT16 subunit
MQCRDYVRNRRLSEQMNSADEKEDEQWNYNRQDKFNRNRKDFKNSFQSNTARDREPGKVTRYFLHFFPFLFSVTVL